MRGCKLCTKVDKWFYVVGLPPKILWIVADFFATAYCITIFVFTLVLFSLLVLKK